MRGGSHVLAGFRMGHNRHDRIRLEQAKTARQHLSDSDAPKLSSVLKHVQWIAGVVYK